MIETKHPNRYGQAVEYRLTALLRRHGLIRPLPDDQVSVTVMSFSPLAVRRMRQLAPALPRVQLMELIPPGLKPSRLPFGARIAGPGLGLVRRRPELIRRLKACGHQIYVWTVNDLADVDLVLSLGVDGIITDRPGAVREHLLTKQALVRTAPIGQDAIRGSALQGPGGQADRVDGDHQRG